MNVLLISIISYVVIIVILSIVTKSIFKALKWASLLGIVISIVLGTVVYKDLQTIKSFNEKEVNIFITENQEVIVGAKIVQGNYSLLNPEELLKEQQEMNNINKEKIKIYFENKNDSLKEKTAIEKEQALQEKLMMFAKQQQGALAIEFLQKIKTDEITIKPQIISLELAAYLPPKVIEALIGKAQDIALKTSKTL